MQTNEISKFQIRIQGEPVEAPEGQKVTLFDSLARLITSWEETEYDEEEAESAEEGDEEGEDLLVATGSMDFQLTLNAAAVQEYTEYDPDEFEALSVVITYFDANDEPAYQHVYSCDPTLVLYQVSGVQGEPVEITVSLDYYDADKFQAPDIELTEQTH